MNTATPVTQTIEGTTPRISILVPSYNSGKFLDKALKSALNQEPPPWEVIVQDGGSTDESIETLRSFGERVTWVSERDAGQADALNRALERATGEVVIWLNADDVLAPGSIAAGISAFRGDPAIAFAYGDHDKIDASGALVRRYRSKPYSWKRLYAIGCYIFSGSLFVRRSALIGVGGFDASFTACMDFDLMLRLRQAGRSRYLGVVVGQLRLHDATKSSTIGGVFVREAFRIRLREAGRSKELRAVAVGATIFNALMLVMAPLRHSQYWPRYGRTKNL